MSAAATVVSVQGEAFARGPNGAMRRLSNGDTIQQGEVVVTSMGGQVELLTADGQMLSLGAQESFKFGSETTQATAPEAGEAAIQPVAQQPGEIDVEQLLEQEAAAAGLGGGGENGGSSFVRLMRIVEPLSPLSYEFDNPAAGDIFPSEGLSSDNDLPTAGDLSIFLDEDDISYREGEDVREVAWFDDFVGAIGSYPGGYYDDGNNDLADGDDLPQYSPTTMVGTLNFSYGRDGMGNIQFELPSAELSSGGLPIQYWMSADGHTLVGYVQQGYEFPDEGQGERSEVFRISEESYVKVIFSAEVTDVTTGGFAFTLYGPLDHPDGSTEDNLTVPFRFTVTDGNGDSVTGTLTVNIDDDSPLVVADSSELPTLTLDESPLPSGSVIDKTQGAGNHGFANAISLDGHFGLGVNPDVQNSETQPYVSIHAVGSGAADYYAFTVTEAGSTAVFDIDYGKNQGGSFDPYLHLWDASGNRISYNDDAGTSLGDGGSIHSYDSYLTYTFSTPGTYYVSVGSWPSGSPIPAGGTYQLQVSLTNAIMGGDGNGDGIWTTAADFSGNFDFAFGADGSSDVNFALSLNGEAMGSGLYALGGDGVRGDEIMLSMEDGNIVGRVGDVAYFSISVDSETGVVSFTRYQNVWHDDSGDHDDSAFLNALEGTVLLTATATDMDGDSASAALDLGSGVFSIEDDGPALNNETIFETVSEANIASDYSTGTAANEGPATVSGNLAGLVDFGTDGMNAFAFTSSALQTLYSTEFWGPFPVPVQLRYSIETDGDIATLTAREPDIYPGRPDSSNTVFELELNTQTGAYEFRLHDELRHFGNAEEVIALNFGALIEAVDGDGDTVSLDGVFSINVVDDVPEPVINLTGAAVQHDETPGSQPQPDDDTSSISVAMRFTGIFGIGGVGNTGNDPDVPGSGAIGYARSATPVITTAGSEAGADHLASDSLSLRVIDPASGLQTTEGYDIALSIDNQGRIVGRVDDADAGAMNGKAAFAIALANNGEVFVAQYLSLNHPDASDADDVIDLSGKIALRYSMTDTDGDTRSAEVDVGAMVRFADDGPTLTGQSISQNIQEADIGTAWSTGTNAAEGPAVISGNLAGLVNFGADGMGSFRFAENALDQLIELGLASRQGSYNRPLSFVSNEVDGVVTITATETDIPFNLFNPESWGNTSNLVFELQLNTQTGAYEFRLHDELVHLGGQDEEIGIDFGSMIEAVDGDGDSILLDGKFTIDVVDDAPVLVGESREISEDYAGVLKGNVLANDDAGADHLQSFRWLNTRGEHGDFDGYSNGTYRYNLDNGAAQSLDDGESRTETFRYEVKDSDGDVRTETLTITITGANDAPTISVDTGEWSWSWRHGWRMENDVVDEAAMPDGTNPGSNAEFAYGSFRVADPDGLDDIKSVTINGQTILVGELASSTVNGASGVLTITDYDSNTGVAQYRYELTQATTDGPGKETDVFTLTTSDGDLDSAPATITIEILDDRPLAASFADTLTVEEESIPGVGGNDETDDGYSHIATGNIVDNVNWGADGFGRVTGVVGGGNTGTWDATTQTYTIETAGYKMVVGQDGSYTFTLKDNTLAAGEGENTAALLANGFTVSAQDGDGDPVSGGIKIKVDVVDDVPVLQIPSNLAVNGSFENPELGNGWRAMQSTDGWSATGNQPIEIGHGRNYGVTAKDGDQVLELDSHGNASVAQQVNTEGFGAVTLSFWFASRAHGADIAATNQVEVFWNGQSLGVITDATAGRWTQHSFNVEANADGATELRFVGVGTQDTYGGLIDNVSVVGMPTVDEDGLDGGGAQLLYATASLPVNFGADGPGDWTGITLNTAVDSQGEAVAMEAAARDDGAWYGVAGGRDVFKVVVDVDAGTYSFTLIDQLDHAEGSDFMKLDFGFTVTDGDGDAISGMVSVGVFDDAPIALDDTDTVVNLSADGNVITGADTTSDGADSGGADESATITKVVGYNGSEDSEFDDDGNLVVEGQFGTLTVKADGSYTYSVDESKLPQPTTVDNPSWNSTNLTAFKLGESFFDANGHYSAGAATGQVSTGGIGGGYFGVKGTSGQNTQVATQINYSGSVSEALAFGFGGPVSAATVGISNLIYGERESARWHAFDADGVRIGTGVISRDATGSYANTTEMDGNGHPGTFTVSGIGAFNTLVFEAVPYSGNASSSNDNSDYFVKVLSYDALPQEGFDYQDVFTYTLTDVDGDSDTATLTIDGFKANPTGNLVNQAPVAADNDYEVGAGGTASGNIITDDNDAGGARSGRDWDQDTPVQNLRVGSVTVGGQTHVLNEGDNTVTWEDGTLVINPNGGFTYTPSETAQGDVSFSYALADIHGEASEPAVVTILNVNPNLPPDAVDDEVDTVQGQAVTIDALGNDSDPDGDNLSITDVSNGTYGTATVVNGQVVYTPTANPGPDGLVDTLTYTISDGQGGTDTAEIKVNIADVGPTANPDTVRAGDVGTATVNLVLVLDSSGSISNSNMTLIKQAVTNLMNSYGDALVKVMLVDFDNSASVKTVNGEVWLTKDQATGQLTSITSGGMTDYDDALAAVQNNYGAPPAADHTYVYFLSDGEPTSSDGSGASYNPNSISDGERQNWVDFLSTNGIDEVYAVGIGSGVSQTDSDLRDVAWSSSGSHDANVVLIASANDLSGTLTDIAETSRGNVTDNDIAGADGLGAPALVSVSFGGTTYAFDTDNDSFTIPLGAGKGTLVIEEDGSYIYTPPSGGAYGAPVVVEYTLQDGDGSRSNSTLTIDPNDVPSATDDFDTADVAYWQASGNVTASASVVMPATWSAAPASTGMSNLSIDPSYWSNDGDTSNSIDIKADAEHPATVSFKFQVSGYQNNSSDSVKVSLLDANGASVQTMTYDTSSDPNASFTITTGGVYRIRLWGDDNTFFNGNLKAVLKDVSYSSYSYTAASTQVVANVTAPGMLWVAALAATGNVMANDDGGIEGAVVAEVNGQPVGTIAGAYGTLVIAADGEYTYTPTTTEVPAGAQEVFNYTIAQGDGETASASLTIDVGDHIYTPTSGSDLLVGGSGGDIIDGLDGNDRIVGGDGDDVLTGGAGTDYIEGGAGNDTLYGGADSDYLSGGEGDDILVGGAGNDILEGGLGADTFVWTLADVGDGTGTAPHDVVKDFSVAEGDVLDLSSVLTDTTTVIAVDSGGKLGLQVVDVSDPAKVYQTITVESVAFGADEVTTILNNLKDHGTSD
jgi:T1SS-143 domain-containing protein